MQTTLASYHTLSDLPGTHQSLKCIFRANFHSVALLSGKKCQYMTLSLFPVFAWCAASLNLLSQIVKSTKLQHHREWKKMSGVHQFYCSCLSSFLFNIYYNSYFYKALLKSNVSIIILFSCYMWYFRLYKTLNDDYVWLSTDEFTVY